MSHSTYYSGSMDIEPKLTQEELLRFAQVIDFQNSDELLKGLDSDVFEPKAAPMLTDADRAFIADIEPPYCMVKVGISADLKPDMLDAENNDDSGWNSYPSDETTALDVAARWLHQNGHRLTGAINWNGDGQGDTGTIYAAFVDGKPRVEDVGDKYDNDGPSWQAERTPKNQLAAVRAILARFPLGKDEDIEGSDAVDALNELHELLNPEGGAIAATKDQPEQTGTAPHA